MLKSRSSEKGLGLGLAIVDRISRLLGHAIDVRSRPGRGPCFAVTVPLVQGTGMPLQCKPADVAPPGTERTLTILCLDNDATILDGLTALLTGWGHRVVVADDADRAMAAATNCRPDVVLLDYHLGQRRSGLDFLDDLRQKAGLDFRALVVTGGSQRGSAQGGEGARLRTPPEAGEACRAAAFPRRRGVEAAVRDPTGIFLGMTTRILIGDDHPLRAEWLHSRPSSCGFWR